MSELRIRGEEVQVRLVRNGVLEKTLTAIKSITMEVGTRVLTDQYLGETTTRKDDIYDGCRGTLSIHPESQDIYLLAEFIRDRASRRTPTNQKINITFRSIFPNGDKPRINIPDAKFGPIPINVGGRDAYVEMSFPYEADDFELIPS